MKKNLISIAVGTVTLLLTTTTLAVPFSSFDPKSMAMGGAGVAVASPGSAPLFNPALLSIADESDDFALELPIVGARVFDPDDFVDAVDAFDDTVVTNLDSAITAYNTALAAGTVDSTATVTALNAVNDEVLTLSDKPFQLEAGAGVILSIPGEKFGMAFSASATANFSGVLTYKDADTIINLTSDLTTLDGCSAFLPADQAGFDNCINTNTFTFIDTDPLSPTFGEVTFTASDTGGTSDIQSTVHVVGVVLAEAGLTFSREMEMFGTEVAIGLTPKYVSVTVFDYEANADTADTSDIDADNFSADYSDFNLDIGIAMDHKNGWRSGLVVKNIISQDYAALRTDPVTGVQTATGLTISLKPQARLGVSHTNSWSTVALDVDLTENEGLGLIDDKSQFVALGLELDAFDTAQLRFGYRADMVNSDRNVVSAGIGLSPFGIHLDLAVAANDNEIGASFRLGFRF